MAWTPNRPDIQQIQAFPVKKSWDGSILRYPRVVVTYHEKLPCILEHYVSLGSFVQKTYLMQRIGIRIYNRPHIIIDLSLKLRITLDTTIPIRFEAHRIIRKGVTTRKVSLITINSSPRKYPLDLEKILHCENCPAYNDVLVTGVCCQLAPAKPKNLLIERNIEI